VVTNNHTSISAKAMPRYRNNYQPRYLKQHISNNYSVLYQIIFIQKCIFANNLYIKRLSDALIIIFLHYIGAKIIL